MRIGEALEVDVLTLIMNKITPLSGFNHIVFMNSYEEVMCQIPFKRAEIITVSNGDGTTSRYIQFYEADAPNNSTKLAAPAEFDSDITSKLVTNFIIKDVNEPGEPTILSGLVTRQNQDGDIRLSRTTWESGVLVSMEECKIRL